MEKMLRGIRVVDVSRVLAGPFCACLLADMGAEVIKIESPGVGDDVRLFGPFQNKTSLYFANVNRGKKSITLDLNNDKAREIIYKLVKESDVYLENFKPGIMKKFGLDYESIKKVKPDIVYASISGFGQYGPYSARAAYDLIMQSMSGLMSMTGFPDRPPSRVGTSISDVIGALFTTVGILGALHYRGKTGKGENVDVSMLDATISTLENAVFRYTVNGEIPERYGNRHAAGGPHNAHRTKDGWISIACGNNSLWKRLLKVVGHEELANDPAFTNITDRKAQYDTVDRIINEWTETKTNEEALQDLVALGIPAGPVYNMKQVTEDPHINARAGTTRG